MSLQELSPRRLPRPFWRWLDAVSFQNVPDRVVCQIVAEVGQGSLYPPIAPRAILFSHCGQPKQQFPGALEYGPEVGAYCQRAFDQSDFGATSTEFPARRWSPLAPTFSGPAFSL